MSSDPETLSEAEFRVLEVLRGEPHLSQRQLASRLGIALGLANKMLGMLARKGYLNFENLGKNRMSYLLTPKGMAEKGSRLVAHLQNTAVLFRQARQLVLARLSTPKAGALRSVAIYGCGDVGELVYHALHAEGIPELAFVDPGFEGRSFLGRRVLSLDEAAARSPDLLFVTTPRAVDEAALRLSGLSCPVLQFPTGLDLPSGHGVTPVSDEPA